MKLILALFLCGVVYTTASPTCSEKQLDQCGSYPDGDDEYKETEAYLDEVCRSMGCMTNYKRRCGTTGLVTHKAAMVKHSEKIYESFCGPKNKKNRQIYLDNAKCLIGVSKAFMTECSTYTGIDVLDSNFCPSVEKYISCTSGLIHHECGSDSGKLYDALIPDKELYGC